MQIDVAYILVEEIKRIQQSLECASNDDLRNYMQQIHFEIHSSVNIEKALCDNLCKVYAAVKELASMGIIDEADVIDYHRERIKKAYPAYFDTYKDMDKLIEYLNGFGNLYCVGRNGQHRYNNMDHSMATAMVAANLIKTENNDKTALWEVNTEQEYHEVKEENEEDSQEDKKENKE